MIYEFIVGKIISSNIMLAWNHAARQMFFVSIKNKVAYESVGVQQYLIQLKIKLLK